MAPDRAALIELYSIEAPLWGWPADYAEAEKSPLIVQLLKLLYAHPSARKSQRLSVFSAPRRRSFVTAKKFKPLQGVDRKRLAANDKD